VEITQEKINNLKSRIKINLKKEDYEPQVKKSLKNITKTAQIKGFRPGMVPVDMVKKMYGNGVLAEELDKKLNAEIYKYIDENKVEIIASPIPAEGQKLDIDINTMKDIDFEYEVGHAPEFDLSYLDNAPAFNKYKIIVDDTMINEEVLRVRKRFATYEYPETVGENDILTFTVEELNENGEVKEGGLSTVSSIMVELLKEDAKAKILAMKKQETITLNVWEAFDRDREGVAKNILNMNDLSKIDEVGNNFKLTLNNITRSVPAEINEEFFQKVYGETGPKTEEEMRNNIKSDLENYFEGSTDNYLVNDLYKNLMDNMDFPLPDDFLKRWIDVTNEKPITAEEIERDYPLFAKQLRWSLIQRKVVSEQSLDVSLDEVKDKLRVNLIQQLYGYGLKNIGEEWIEEYVNKQLNDRKMINETRDQLLGDKVLGYVKSKVKLDEKPVTMDEFKAMIDTQQQ
jgi:trigger factor